MRLLFIATFALCTPTTLAFDDGDGLRNALVPVGDVDGDGFVDFAMAHRPGTLRVPTGTQVPWVSQEPSVEIRSSADGKVLRTFDGAKGFGTELEAVGDLDGDGIAELLVGHGRNNLMGGVVLLSPGAGTVLHTFGRPAGAHHFGRGLAGGQQLVGDETPDLVIGEEDRAWIVDGRLFEPRAVLVALAGRTVRVEVDSWERVEPEGAPLPKLDTKGPWGYGSSDTNYLGDVKLLADLDGDGLGELILTTRFDPALEITDAVPFEKGGSALRPATPLDHPVVSRLIYSAGGEPFVFRSAAWLVLTGVDLDGDGVEDLLTTTVNRRIRAWSLGKRALWWESSFDGGYLHADGTSLAWTSDHNGDGVPDFVHAANETFLDQDRGYVEINSPTTGGRMQLFTPPKVETGLKGYAGGVDANVLEDLDGDGFPEVITFQPHGRILALLDGKTLEVVWEVVLVEPVEQGEGEQ